MEMFYNRSCYFPTGVKHFFLFFLDFLIDFFVDFSDFVVDFFQQSVRDFFLLALYPSETTSIDFVVKSGDNFLQIKYFLRYTRYQFLLTKSLCQFSFTKCGGTGGNSGDWGIFTKIYKWAIS